MYEKPLTKLEDWNKPGSSRFKSLENEYPLLNGIECPKCKNEMSDMDDMILCSYPPKKKVKCLSCGHDDYRNL